MDHIRAALDSIQQPALAADLQGRVVAANAAARALLDVAVGADLQAAWQQRLGDAGWQHWQATAAAGQPGTDTLPPLATAGRWRYRATPVFNPADGGRWLVTLERETLGEDSPRDLVQLGLAAALRVGQMGLWEWSPGSGDSLWSPELYDVLRLPRGRGIEPGERFLQMVHPEDLGLIDAAVSSADAKGCIDPFMFRVVLGDGATRWIMTCAVAHREPGQPLSRLVGVNFDVTETVEAERQLDDARRAGERQTQIVQAVMENAPVGIAVAFNGEQGLAYVNRFGLEMLDATPDTDRGWGSWEVYHLDGITPAAQPEMALSRAMAGETIRNQEWLIRTMAGTLLPISCNSGPIRAGDGSVIGGAVAWYDVTPFKQLQKQRELFLAAVSHELRTPLNAIGSWAQALRRPEPSAEFLARAVSAIWRNVETAARLLEDLLDLSRMSSGHLTLDLAEADLGEIVLHAVDTVAPLAEAAQVMLHIAQLPFKPVLLRADGVRLQQAVCNLLTNAVKFSPPAGLVEVTLQRQGEWALLTVSDHGAGIAPEHLERVFDHFWQARSGAAGGLGLGLAIARHIVCGHGGTLAAESAGLGHGASFVLRLPLADDD